MPPVSVCQKCRVKLSLRGSRTKCSCRPLLTLEFQVHFRRSVGPDPPTHSVTGLSLWIHIGTAFFLPSVPACVCVTLVRLFALFSGGAPPCSGCWRWGHANFARAPCLQSHMSRLSLRTPPRAAERVWCAHWLLSVPLCLSVKGLLMRENWHDYTIYMIEWHSNYSRCVLRY